MGHRDKSYSAISYNYLIYLHNIVIYPEQNSVQGANNSLFNIIKLKKYPDYIKTVE
jgi:hypothetical protein